MDDGEWLAKRFETHRPRLQAVAYRMLGSLVDADDAVQDAWLRLSRSGPDRIDDLGAWLTTVVARECLHILRSRRHRREESLESRLPDPIVTADEKTDPEQETLLADSVGLALLIVLDCLTPPSGWRSCYTTCSSCRSRRSPSWSGAPPLPPGSWPAVHGDE
jgi:RNA polymerase sigma factor (sigma-70 family)